MAFDSTAFNPASLGGAGMAQGLDPQANSTFAAFRQRLEPSAFDTFQRSMTQPTVNVSQSRKLLKLISHPFQTVRLLKQLPTLGNEDRTERIYQYLSLKSALPASGKDHLKSLLKEGVLNNNQSDDGRSTLYQLYSMLTTRRATGYNNEYLLNETVRILNKPYLITQKFAPLSENIGKEMLRIRNNSGMTLNRSGEAPPAKPLGWADIDVKNSATCVSSSVMYYMADKEPAELARHLNELTSPLKAFYEKVKPEELSPDQPELATEILKQQNIQYQQIGPDELLVKVELPTAGYLRAIDSNDKRPKNNVRTGIEAAYQSALTYLATRSYDPATDMRDSETPGEGSKGLTEPEKTLMETIVKDNGGVMSVTYQVVAGKENPQPGQEGLPFLYGYTRDYQQTAGDIIEALKMGQFVIIGITDTDSDGSIAGGHEITITSAFVDKKDNQLKFVVVDSDDDIAAPVVRTAKELVPKIHHAGMPLQLARSIQQDIDATPGYYVPTQSDESRFESLSLVREPLPADAFGAPTQEELEEPHNQQMLNQAELVNASPEPTLPVDMPAQPASINPNINSPASHPASIPSQPVQPGYDWMPVLMQPQVMQPQYGPVGYAQPSYSYPGTPAYTQPSYYPTYPAAHPTIQPATGYAYPQSAAAGYAPSPYYAYR